LIIKVNLAIFNKYKLHYFINTYNIYHREDFLALPTERQCAPADRLEIDMPRYYFHVKDGKSYPDLQGTVLDDLEAAKVEAVRFGGDILSHAVKAWSGEEWTMEVADPGGSVLFALKFPATFVNTGAND
jgi:hypothetical protein